MKYLIAFFGASAVLLGALGAHTLAPYMEASALNSFKTGVLYQLVHTVALLAASKSVSLVGAEARLASRINHKG